MQASDIYIDPFVRCTGLPWPSLVRDRSQAAAPIPISSRKAPIAWAMMLQRSCAIIRRDSDRLNAKEPITRQIAGKFEMGRWYKLATPNAERITATPSSSPLVVSFKPLLSPFDSRLAKIEKHPTKQPALINKQPFCREGFLSVILMSIIACLEGQLHHHLKG